MVERSFFGELTRARLFSRLELDDARMRIAGRLREKTGKGKALPLGTTQVSSGALVLRDFHLGLLRCLDGATNQDFVFVAAGFLGVSV